jgi:hypothetical protein
LQSWLTAILTGIVHAWLNLLSGWRYVFLKFNWHDPECANNFFLYLNITNCWPDIIGPGQGYYGMSWSVTSEVKVMHYKWICIISKATLKKNMFTDNIKSDYVIMINNCKGIIICIYYSWQEEGYYITRCFKCDWNEI